MALGKCCWACLTPDKAASYIPLLKCTHFAGYLGADFHALTSKAGPTWWPSKVPPQDKPPISCGGSAPHQDVQAGCLEQGDLVSDAEGGEAWQALCELHNLDDALGGQFTELVPQPQVQLNPVICTGILEGRTREQPFLGLRGLQHSYFLPRGTLVGRCRCWG